MHYTDNRKRITGNNPVFLTLACFVKLRAVAHVCVRGQDIVRNDYQRCHTARASSARESARASERERARAEEREGERARDQESKRARLQATCYTKPADSAVRAASARAETLQQCERDNERIHTHLHPPGDPLWPIDTSLTVTASVNFCTTILLISKIQHGIRHAGHDEAAQGMKSGSAGDPTVV
jgi:hypothetical protein